jgi:hypothetical protein
MSPAGGDAWLTFSRTGGRAPRDDETLSVAEDGTFEARRTLGGPRVGTFRGQLPERAARALRKAVAALEDAEDLEIPTPREGATEVLACAGRTLRTGSNERAPKPWRAALDLTRALLEDEVVEAPLAAVELVADERSARLAHAGTEPVEVDTGSVVVNVVRLGDDGAVLARWRGRRDDRLVSNGETLVAEPEWVTATPGWTAELPFDHPVELARGDWLQVWVDLPVRDAGGERAARLYVPVGED